MERVVREVDQVTGTRG